MDNNSTEKFTAGRQKMIIKWDRLACILCFFFLMHVAAMQLLYMTVGKAFEMVYMAGWMEYAVNGICLLLLWGGLFSLLYNRKSEPKSGCLSSGDFLVCPGIRGISLYGR